MSQSRLDQLLKFLESDPRDSFTLYAVAMEYVKEGRHAEAIEAFEKIIRYEPTYVPSYHQLGRLYVQLGRQAEARNMFEQGIRMAGELGDEHAGAEMEEELNDLS